MSRLIAITGGIGAGKSVVSRCLVAMGYEVYDCDSRAKRIMEDERILLAIEREIAPGCVDFETGTINRLLLADVVFNDSAALQKLNGLVHSAVRDDISIWARYLPVAVGFVETAILYQSELDKMVEQVWEVKAPRAKRLSRVMQRNNLSSVDVQARIDSQDSFQPDVLHPKVYPILNDDVTPILPQILSLIDNI